MIFVIKLSNVSIRVKTVYDTFYVNFHHYIYDSKPYKKTSINICITSTILDQEERRLNRFNYNDNVDVVDYQRSKQEIEANAVYREICDEMPRFNTFLMHGSVIAKDGYAYMFTAPSGIGKTTRTRLWLDLYPDAIVVNGDKPLIKITSSEAIACGTPWCGKEGWNTNTMVPLRAIFLLERAEEGEKSSIEEISLGKAFPFLLQQTYRPEDPDLMRKTLALLKSLEGKVKIYKFRSTPTEESVRLAYETARPR